MGCSEWKEYSLNDVIDKFIDYRGRTPKKVESGIPLITAKIVKNGRIEEATEFIKPEDYDKWMTRGIPMNGDVVMTTEAPLGEVAQIYTNEKIALAQRIITLRGKKDILDNTFLKYSLQSPIMQWRIQSRASGTTVLGIKSSELKKVTINLPSLQVQRNISSVLSSLDKKIELNNEMNKTLEEMAQALFKRWFVDFEFPNEEGKPYKSSGGEMVESEMGVIPKGWSIISLSQIVDTFNGYSYKGKELLDSKDALVTIKNFDRNGGYKIDGLKQIVISDRVKEHHYVDLNDIVVAHTDLTQNAEIIGNPIMILSKGRYDKLIISMDTVKVKSKQTQYSNSIIYYILKYKRFKNFAKSHTKGTTVLHLPKDTILNYRIALPCNESIIIQLGDMLSRLIKKIKINYNENENLIELRDSLLPKLMSGEIRVNDIEANL